HLVFRGNQLALISERNGKALTINVEPDDPTLPEIFCSIRHLLNRGFHPIKQLTIETINNETAARSPYVNALKTSFEVLIEFKKVTLYRKI
ncbi:hypothetical protein KKA14_20550, partial [bacterium]|nr:hypothetical protein [bacterium]